MPATMTMLRPGARLWRADGEAATVTAVRPQRVYARIDGERLPAVLWLDAWRLALTCEYCDRQAEVQLIDGQPGDVLCKACAHDQFDQVSDWVRPIPRTVIRALYGQCDRLHSPASRHRVEAMAAGRNPHPHNENGTTDDFYG